jgi:ribosome-binding protein aMBF1 (putative translation factor)
MKAVKSKSEKFKTVGEFGRSLGLSDLEMELIRQKKRLIEKLKDARIKEGISQASLAEQVGSKQPAIARMESGQVSEVSMDFLTKVALTLEVQITIRPSREAA